MKSLIIYLCATCLCLALCHQSASSASRYTASVVSPVYTPSVKTVRHEPRTWLGRLFAAMHSDAMARRPRPAVEGVNPNPFATIAAVAAGTGIIAVAVAGLLNLSWILLIGVGAGLVATVCGAIGIGRKRKNRWLAALSMGIGIGLILGGVLGYVLDNITSFI